MTNEALALARDTLERIATADDMNPASLASAWETIREVAAGELAGLDVTVERIPWGDAEELQPMLIDGQPAGFDADGKTRAWAANSEEVAAFCLNNGLEFKITRNRNRWPCVALVFDSKPDAEFREQLKSNGFQWDKPLKQWEHNLYGDNANPDCKAARLRREVAS